MRKKTSQEIRHERTVNVGVCKKRLVIAHLWPKDVANIGTLARTADAIGACLALPNTSLGKQCLAKGNTIGIDRVHVHWVGDPLAWLRTMRSEKYYILGVELSHGAISLKDLQPRYNRSVLVLGNESKGIPDVAWEYIDQVTEIPMEGAGNSLNVSVAASLVAYKLLDMI
jgi:tRNA (guanosine-2'-O-)-methyltransferase